ncbi:hypothetical protein JQX13_22480 [Archangium violaceum]|uniref:hypothetical protein n=1 Tax=Archangium violaceum TaxID=83451 RepID=UPI00193AFE3B|nr:hypothetical protein [Archangium violaceum]QRK12547.1 hypothetical protein JQX13_22480 [Archangium violaceum]
MGAWFVIDAPNFDMTRTVLPPLLVILSPALFLAQTDGIIFEPPDYLRIMLGGGVNLLLGVLVWRASRYRISSAILALLVGGVSVWLILQKLFLGPLAGYLQSHHGGSVACGLLLVGFLPTPFLSVVGIVQWARRRRLAGAARVDSWATSLGSPVWKEAGGILLFVLFSVLAFAIAIDNDSNAFEFSPVPLAMGLLLLLAARLSWEFSQHQVPVTLLLFLVGAVMVWSTAMVECVSDLAFNGELLRYSNPPFGCGPMMPFVLPLAVVSLGGLVRWAWRRYSRIFTRPA